MSKRDNLANKDIFVRTTDTQTIKSIIETSKDVLGDVHIDFINNPKNTDSSDKKKSKDDKKQESGGIKIVATDDNQNLLVVIKLDSKRFEPYHVCQDVFGIDVNLPHLHMLTKSLEKDDILTIYMNSDDKSILTLDVSNEAKNMKSICTINTLTKNDNKRKFPNHVLSDYVVTIDNPVFHKVCKDLGSIAQYVEIVCTEKSIKFTAPGDSMTKCIIYNTSDTCVKIKQTSTNTDTSIYTGLFEIEYFTMFSKCANLCPYIQLFLKNDAPLYTKYTIGTASTIKVGIAPSLVNKYENMTYNEVASAHDKVEPKFKNAE